MEARKVWSICQAEPGPTFAAFEPAGGVYQEVTYEDWPTDLHPNTGDRREVELFRQKIEVTDLNEPSISGTEYRHFVRWLELDPPEAKASPPSRASLHRSFKASPANWTTARLYTTHDAFSTLW
jgi:hypothetical protein